MDYCAALGLAPIDDPSNRDPRFLRSRVRHELLPALEGVFPGARRRLATLALRQRDLLEGGDVAGPAVIGNKAVTPRSRLPRSSEPLL
jgi:tRNA(Ile)-lysidine synthase TilS/MesJ